MRLWRLSSARRANDFDGGFGLVHDGRWNSRGCPVTYCATVASLAALEKRVHVTDPALLPPQMLVEYEAPDDFSMRRIEIEDLPADWAERQTHTQGIGDAWLDAATEVLLFVPSAVVPIARAPDRNVLVNHRARDVGAIKMVAMTPFALDSRLFRR